jgi:hypothetical protein
MVLFIANYHRPRQTTTTTNTRKARIETPPDKSKERRLLQQLWIQSWSSNNNSSSSGNGDTHRYGRHQYCPPHRQRQCCRVFEGKLSTLDFQLRRRQTNQARRRQRSRNGECSTELTTSRTFNSIQHQHYEPFRYSAPISSQSNHRNQTTSRDNSHHNDEGETKRKVTSVPSTKAVTNGHSLLKPFVSDLAYRSVNSCLTPLPGNH